MRKLSRVSNPADLQDDRISAPHALSRSPGGGHAGRGGPGPGAALRRGRRTESRRGATSTRAGAQQIPVRMSAHERQRSQDSCGCEREGCRVVTCLARRRVQAIWVRRDRARPGPFGRPRHPLPECNHGRTAATQPRSVRGKPPSPLACSTYALLPGPRSAACPFSPAKARTDRAREMRMSDLEDGDFVSLDRQSLSSPSCLRGPLD